MIQMTNESVCKAVWAEKVWGRTRCTHCSDLYSRHELEVEMGGYCSFHFHNERANRFTVESGIVRVVCAFGWKICYKDLTAGNVLDVPSMVPHQFQVLEKGVMVEEYYPDRGDIVDDSDIIRLSVGGMTQVKTLLEVVCVMREQYKPWYGCEELNHD